MLRGVLNQRNKVWQVSEESQKAENYDFASKQWIKVRNENLMQSDETQDVLV